MIHIMNNKANVIDSPFSVCQRNEQVFFQVFKPDGTFVELPKPQVRQDEGGLFVAMLKDAKIIPGEMYQKYVKGIGYIVDETESIPGELKNFQRQYGAKSFSCVSAGGRAYQFEFGDPTKAKALFDYLNKSTCYMGSLRNSPLPTVADAGEVPDTFKRFRPEDLDLINS